jgi:aminoglycoside phosphotransferase (APT) family kinase protein
VGLTEKRDYRPEVLSVAFDRLAVGLSRDLATIVAPDAGSVAAKATLLNATSLLQRYAAADSILRRAAEAQVARGALEDEASRLLDITTDDPLAALAGTRLSAAGESARRAILSRAVDIHGALQTDIEALGVPKSPAGTQVMPIAAADILVALTPHFPGVRLSVDNIRLVPGGFSKQIIMFELSRNGAESETLVIRIEGSHKIDKTTLPLEFALLGICFRAGLPVAEPLLFEPRIGPLRAPFLVTRRAPGRNYGNAVTVTEPVPVEAVRDVARTVAKLHSLSPDSFGQFLTPSIDLARQILDRIDAAEAEWLRDRSAESPLLSILFAWLRANMPVSLSASCLIHGDVGFHNILIDEGRVTALLDWERARVGDPMEELSYLKPYVVDALPWKEFVSIYEAAGGAPYLEESVRYYDVWRGAWLTATCFSHGGRFDADPTRIPLPSAFAAMIYGPRFLMQGARALQRALSDIPPGPAEGGA